MLFLGDQVYADETTEEMQEFIEARRDIEEPPGKELKDYEEYAHLYALAWTDPANRWLLSTLPSAMIFDDHDVRDDWNTSLRVEAEDGEDRLVARADRRRPGVVLGLPAPRQHVARRARRGRGVAAGRRSPRRRATSSTSVPALDDLADRVDQDPEAYRWSYSRDLAGVRLIVRRLPRRARARAERRATCSTPSELAWLDEQMRGDVRHLLVGTSLPFLLPPGLHHLEAWNEAVGRWRLGRGGRRFGEWMRQTVDLEHWGAFQKAFQQVARMATEVADGKRGRPPQHGHLPVRRRAPLLRLARCSARLGG